MQELQHDNTSSKTDKSSALKKIKRIVLYIILAFIFLHYLTFFTAKSGFNWFKYVIWAGIAYLIYRNFGRIKALFSGQTSSTANGNSEMKVNPNLLDINGVCQIENPFSGVLILGGAGSGKSKSLVEPIIRQAGQKQWTGIVYDFKFPVLAEYVNAAYKQSSVKRFYVNFSDLNYSHLLNPIAPEIMTNSSFAREFASAIMNNINPTSFTKPDFWSDNSELMLSAVFWFLREELPEMCDLPHAISLIMTNQPEKLISLLQSNSETADMIAPLAASVGAGAGNQTAGIISSLQVALNKINTPEVYFVCGANTGEEKATLNLNNPQAPAVLTIGNNPTLAKTYGPVIGLIITAASKLLNQPNKAPSMILADEFPTLILPNVEQIPATARSNKVSTILAAQDISQIEDKYGKQKGEAILSNLGNQFYGRTTNTETARRVSSLFGKEEKRFETTSESKGQSTGGGSGFFGKNSSNNSTSTSVSYQERDLVKTQEVMKQDTGSFYVQLSEGYTKQGHISVPMADFEPIQLEAVRTITREDIKANYDRIKAEARELLNF